MQPTHAQSSVAAPNFSVIHGFYSAPFQLTLNTATTGAQIRYTTNFTTPSVSNGTLYNTPIAITTTTVIRAIAYLANGEKSPVVTQTYLFTTEISKQSNQPGPGWPNRFSANNQYGGPYTAYYEMAPEIVTAYTSQVDGALRDVPTLSIVTELPNLWDVNTGIYYNSMQKGSTWERPISLEWIDPTGATPGFSENAGVRIHGQSSRWPHRTPKKAFRLYFKSAYGNKKLNFKLFDAVDAVGKFDQLVLRGGNIYSWPVFSFHQRQGTDYIGDEFARNVFLEMGWLTARGTFVHLYLNGIYWGLYNLTERIDDKFLRDNLGGTEFDYDLIGAPEEVGYTPTAEVGSIDAYNQLLLLLNQPSISDQVYAQVQTKLDVVNLADYMVLLHYIANSDWPSHNWYVYRKQNGADTHLRVIIWDSEASLHNLTVDSTLLTDPDSPAGIFHKLMTNGEFRRLVADRLWFHLVRPQGLLTPDRCRQRWLELSTLIDPAIIGESMRWGAYAEKIYPQMSINTGNTATPAYLYTRDLPKANADPNNDTLESERLTWVDGRDDKLNTYCPQRTGIVIDQYKNNGWYSDSLQPPTFTPQGGSVVTNTILTLTNPNPFGAGVIYYTTDGSDPRQSGDVPSVRAINGEDVANVTINKVMTVKARIYEADQWSALNEAIFYPPQTFQHLVINEIHYHPLALAPVDGDDFQFIELYNKGTTTLQLDNVYFGRGVYYRFPLGTTLAPAGFLVLARNATQFQSRYGFAPAGELSGDLANSGETVELFDALGNSIDSVTYSDLAPWPLAADGTGPSLSLIQPTSDNALPQSWGASTALNGTPGRANDVPLPNLPPGITMTSPSAGAILASLHPITITANAVDSDGVVTEVLFLVDHKPLSTCRDTSTPFACRWSPPRPGSYLLSAQATDNRLATTVSAPITLTIHNQPPTVLISTPVTEINLPLASPITINALAEDGDGTLTVVAFFANQLALPGCLTLTAPFVCPWMPTQPGQYTLSASVTDNFSATITSAPITVTVNPAPPVNPTPPVNQPPVVVLGGIAEGSQVAIGQAITLTAQASDGDGTVSQVQFFYNGIELPSCLDSALPFECNWTPGLAGSYRWTAQAVDNAGASALSNPLLITVTDLAPPTNLLPTIQILAPLTATVFTPTHPLTIQVQASDSDGAVRQVEFFANEAALAGCIDQEAPFACLWTPGDSVYTLIAIGTDDRGGSSRSAPVVITPGAIPTPRQDPYQAYLPIVTK